jgi:hypothetical protein
METVMPEIPQANCATRSLQEHQGMPEENPSKKYVPL